MHLRGTKKLKSDISLYDPIGTDQEGNEVKLMDILGTGEDIVSETVANTIEEQKLLSLIKKLNKRERKVLELRYGLYNGLRRTQREIAKMLGISRSYVSRIEKKAVKRLLKEFSSEGYR